MISWDRKEFGQIELQAGAERVSDDVDATVLEQTTDPEDQVIDIPEDVKTEVLKDPEPKPEQPQKVAETASKKAGIKTHPAIANLEVTMKQFPKEYREACIILKIEPDAEIRVPEAVRIMAEIGKIVDKANA